MNLQRAGKGPSGDCAGRWGSRLGIVHIPWPFSENEPTPWIDSLPKLPFPSLIASGWVPLEPPDWVWISASNHSMEVVPSPNMLGACLESAQQPSVDFPLFLASHFHCRPRPHLESGRTLPGFRRFRPPQAHWPRFLFPGSASSWPGTRAGCGLWRRR